MKHVAKMTPTDDGPRASCSCGWTGTETKPTSTGSAPQQHEALAHVAEMRNA